MKYLPWILIVLLVAFAWVEVTQWQAERNLEKAELKAIKHEKAILAILLQNSTRRQQRLVDSIYNRVEDNKRLRRLNEASNTRLKRERETRKLYEKKLDSILFYTDAVMDSLYRARYPQPDTLHKLCTAPGMD